MTDLKDFINLTLEGDAYKADLSKVLPPAISAERFVAVLKNFLKSNARSKEMINALGDDAFTRNSLLQEALKCASDGLVPDGREASLNLSKKNVGRIYDQRTLEPPARGLYFIPTKRIMQPSSSHGEIPCNANFKACSTMINNFLPSLT